MCSALARRTSVAMVLTYLTLLVLFVVPMGMGWYLQGIPRSRRNSWPHSPSPARTRRPSASRCTPRRSEAWMQPAEPVARSVLIPITPGLPAAGLGDLPADLSAALPGVFFVTYLAFRWRWWRAGGIGLAGSVQAEPIPATCIDVSFRVGVDWAPSLEASAERPVLEIPHLVGPAHERDLHRDARDRPGLALAADRDLQGVLGVDR